VARPAARFRFRAVAEFAGTAVLVCVVVGSGIMATNQTDDTGVAFISHTQKNPYFLDFPGM
jgi:glycerol uptake facilitator-like aquaporin